MEFVLSQCCVYVVDGCIYVGCRAQATLHTSMLAVVHKRRYTNVLSSEWGERGICMAIGGRSSVLV